MLVLLTGEGHLHGFSHSYMGAILLGVFSAITGKYLADLGLRVLRIPRSQNPIQVRWCVCFMSAFIGTFSHVVIDSFMHQDMEPFYPF
ncbi:MAG: DUF4184 family protein [Pseudomonadales bacterium]|nr:DUF4184 family protein [Pseudomonadales bacterium]